MKVNQNGRILVFRYFCYVNSSGIAQKFIIGFVFLSAVRFFLNISYKLSKYKLSKFIQAKLYFAITFIFCFKNKSSKEMLRHILDLFPVVRNLLTHVNIFYIFLK